MTSLVGAKQVITEDWGRQAAHGQRRWAYLFDEGLVNTGRAAEWADSVSWPHDDEADAVGEESV